MTISKMLSQSGKDLHARKGFRTQMASKKPTIVDLFAGAGLFSFAFMKAGFQIVRSVELDAVAAETYRMNIGDHIEIADIRNVEPVGKCDCLIAGPPCQGFSTLGKRDPSDVRNSLSFEVVRWAKILRPRVVVIENVAIFLESEIWKKVAKGMTRIGYSVRPFVVDAADFGVAQFRRRSFTICLWDRDCPDISFEKVKKRSTVEEALDGLPKKANGINHHTAPTPSALALSRFQVIPEGGDKRDVMVNAPHLVPPSWWRCSQAVTDVWGRMKWNSPANTLRTCLQNPSKGRYIHPDQDRVITLREAARIHSIPDKWEFAGLPTQVARQIGNSVPPALGSAVANAIQSILL